MFPTRIKNGEYAYLDSYVDNIGANPPLESTQEMNSLRFSSRITSQLLTTHYDISIQLSLKLMEILSAMSAYCVKDLYSILKDEMETFNAHYREFFTGTVFQNEYGTVVGCIRKLWETASTYENYLISSTTATTTPTPIISQNTSSYAAVEQQVSTFPSSAPSYYHSVPGGAYYGSGVYVQPVQQQHYAQNSYTLPVNYQQNSASTNSQYYPQQQVQPVHYSEQQNYGVGANQQQYYSSSANNSHNYPQAGLLPRNTTEHQSGGTLSSYYKQQIDTRKHGAANNDRYELRSSSGENRGMKGPTRRPGRHSRSASPSPPRSPHHSPKNNTSPNNRYRIDSPPPAPPRRRPSPQQSEFELVTSKARTTKSIFVDFNHSWYKNLDTTNPANQRIVYENFERGTLITHLKAFCASIMISKPMLKIFDKPHRTSYSKSAQSAPVVQTLSIDDSIFSSSSPATTISNNTNSDGASTSHDRLELKILFTPSLSLPHHVNDFLCLVAMSKYLQFDSFSLRLDYLIDEYFIMGKLPWRYRSMIVDSLRKYSISNPSVQVDRVSCWRDLKNRMEADGVSFPPLLVPILERILRRGVAAAQHELKNEKQSSTNMIIPNTSPSPSSFTLSTSSAVISPSSMTMDDNWRQLSSSMDLSPTTTPATAPSVTNKHELSAGILENLNRIDVIDSVVRVMNNFSHSSAYCSSNIRYEDTMRRRRTMDLILQYIHIPVIELRGSELRGSRYDHQIPLTLNNDYFQLFESMGSGRDEDGYYKPPQNVWIHIVQVMITLSQFIVAHEYGTLSPPSPSPSDANTSFYAPISEIKFAFMSCLKVFHGGVVCERQQLLSLISAAKNDNTVSLFLDGLVSVLKLALNYHHGDLVKSSRDDSSSKNQQQQELFHHSSLPDLKYSDYLHHLHDVFCFMIIHMACEDVFISLSVNQLHLDTVEVIKTSVESHSIRPPTIINNAIILNLLQVLSECVKRSHLSRLSE